MDDIGSGGALMLTIIGFVLYFLPTFNAKSRKHPSRGGIFALNLFLGWTFIGWVAAVIWSASAIRQEQVAGDNPDHYGNLEKLANLKDRGHISAEEFEREKQKLLKG